MAEFKITRFRYIWRGNWATSTSYNKDDVVFWRGSSWVCIRQHTSSIFYQNQNYIAPGNTLASPAWTKTTDGRQFLGEWAASTVYDTGSLVLVGGNVYLCVTGHTSSSQFNTNLLNWEIFATGSNWRTTWTANTRYRVGDVVRYNGYIYQCVLEHTSGTVSQGVEIGDNDASNDSTAETWNIVSLDYYYTGIYQNNTRYRVNDLVKYGGSLLRCITEHTSPNVGITSANFSTYLSGFEYDNEWNPTVYYAVGDVVRYGGDVYVANTNNYYSQPGVTALSAVENSDWNRITEGQDFQGDYDPQGGKLYKKGDVIRRGGSLWISLVNQYTDDSSLMPFDTTNWKLVIAAQNFRGGWDVDADYNYYDVVYFKGKTYFANTPHFSSFENFPGDSGSGYVYWTVLLEGDANAVLTNLGEMLTYNLSREFIQDGSTSFTIGDTSTIGPTVVPIGDQNQLLMVSNNEGDLDYATWGTLHRVIWVRTDGVDENTDPNRGSNYFLPWRTLRYALEQLDDGYEGYTSIKLGTGEFEEVLPLIIPKRTAIIGDELRSTTVRANRPIEALASDVTYTLATLNHLENTIQSILLGNPITRSTGNTVPQNTTLTVMSTEVNIVLGLWADIYEMIDFKVNDQGSAPTVTGSNSASTNQGRLDTRTILESNRELIKQEAISYMEQNNPLYNFDEDRCRRDIDRYIDAVKYDLLYPGNYKSVLAGRYYANAVNGSQLEDMFYVRDTTGVRNITVKGLEGTLPALEEGQVYRTPTGGAFFSLDPGWGPDDERVWIIDRSCYIQNVTTFGTAAIGQKVDGDLHNGGNKSIVSNDFTQVISDGIGAWMLNGGRGELVSVFTYYAHIGMFAQDGGIIRATNGNSSYGDFGAVADGLDADELVKYGKLNTRNEQAVIASAFAGEILDYILGLEFYHCGQNYTYANYTITSSGTGATTTQEEFRDNSMFECQVLDNGANFRIYGNQAQTGNTTSITVATSELFTEAEILGMRVIIISGEGTGQYGYVYSYNDITKILLVYKESTDTPGWDHILPGTPSATLLTAGTRYRIEPRIEFSHPGFSSEPISLPTVGTMAAAVYGETSGTYTNIVGTAGTGVTIDIVPAAAEWTVQKIGRRYEVSLSSGGAGYAVNDTITILGSQVGGTAGEHDITITVTDISDDSTNSILGFIYGDTSIIADSGKFVLTPASGSVGFNSPDGIEWDTFNMPSGGDWRCLTAGNNRFVAIKASSDQAAYSLDGVEWTASSLPSSRDWTSIVYGKPSTVSTGIYVAVASNLNAAVRSVNGVTWSASTLPTFGDSTLNQYVDVAFGSDVFVAIANSSNIAAVGTWNGTTLTWQGTVMDVIADSSQKDWISVAYGNRRFVAISTTGDVAYSFDGLNWLPAAMPTQDGSTAHYWRQIRYGQGVFMAVGDTGSRPIGDDATSGPTTYVVTSYDGIVWNEYDLSNELEWGLVAFGNPDVTLGDSTLTNSKPTWIVIPRTAGDVINLVHTGARILGRVQIGGSGISAIKIWEPGSGYLSEPTITITDPNNTEEIQTRTRFADGVLAQPTFLQKGSSYKTSTTFVTVLGDGFADKTPNGKFITLDDLEILPGPGAQFYIAGQTNYYVAVVVGINASEQPNGLWTSTFQISPQVGLDDFFEHGMEVLIREKYSQVRITGHDFLDIGTGNFEETNYPVLYSNYEFTTEPFQEVQNLNGGRVFYTSTDQDGNFRAGEQFAVEQATGIITISADFFDLSGLTELRLAGINVGSTAIIREFSKDATFSQNSNNVIPTQRAIIAYLQSRLNVGGEDLLTPNFIAGTVLVGPNLINSTAGLTINVPVVANFEGPDSGVSGSFLAQLMLTRRKA